MPWFVRADNREVGVYRESAPGEAAAEPDERDRRDTGWWADVIEGRPGPAGLIRVAPLMVAARDGASKSAVYKAIRRIESAVPCPAIVLAGCRPLVPSHGPLYDPNDPDAPFHAKPIRPDQAGDHPWPLHAGQASPTHVATTYSLDRRPSSNCWRSNGLRRGSRAEPGTAPSRNPSVTVGGDLRGGQSNRRRGPTEAPAGSFLGSCRPASISSRGCRVGARSPSS
jgi:hypothetical protein